jgi:hypothetical protein
LRNIVKNNLEIQGIRKRRIGLSLDMLPAYTTLQIPLNNQPAPQQHWPGSTPPIFPIASNIQHPAISNFQPNAWQHGMMQQLTLGHATAHPQNLPLNQFQQLRQIVQKPRIETVGISSQFLR